MPRVQYHSDIGKPCFRCEGTIFTYYVDDDIPEVESFCQSCHAHKTFRVTMLISSASEASHAHRSS